MEASARFHGGSGQGHHASIEPSVQTRNHVRVLGPKVVLMATSEASRPTARWGFGALCAGMLLTRIERIPFGPRSIHIEPRG